MIHSAQYLASYFSIDYSFFFLSRIFVNREALNIFSLFIHLPDSLKGALLIFLIYQIADGMTIEIHTVNLLLETRGGGRQGGAAW